MYVTRVPNRGSPPAVLLRESYRENGKVKTRTLANLSRWPEELDVEGARTDVPALRGVPRGKLILVNDDDLTYCTLRLDPDSLQTIRTRIADIDDTLPRTLAWSAVWEMTRSAEMRARDFVALVGSGIPAESEVGVAQALLTQARTALVSYAEPGWARWEGWPAFADRLLQLARSAEPGSGHQLAYMNALCTSVLSPRHTETLSGLLHTEPAALRLPGLVVDFDLRWRIVIALATAGVIDADGPQTAFIEAEFQRDPSDAAERNKERAGAARPQAAVKDAAWQRVVGGVVNNTMARAIIAGIVAPGQGELLRPYTRRYFDTISAIWEPSSELAKTIVTGLYPSWDVSQAGIDAAYEFLAGEMDKALRRLVREGQADVIRALAARKFETRANGDID